MTLPPHIELLSFYYVEAVAAMIVKPSLYIK
jgi:hypothetical protein